MNTTSIAKHSNIYAVTGEKGIIGSNCANCGLTIRQVRNGEFPAFHLGTRKVECDEQDVIAFKR